MPDITELNLPDPKKAELIRQRQLRLAKIEAMPDDDPAEADKLIPPEHREAIIKSLREIRRLLEAGKLKK